MRILILGGDGSQARDFIYIEDLLGAIRLADEVAGIGGEVFQIATNTETTVSELVDRLLPVLQQYGITETLVTHGASRRSDVRRNYSDTRKARERLGWQFTHTLERGLEKTLPWFLEERATEENRT